MKVNNPVKILLVDDLPGNLFALELILSNRNYRCVKANSGNEALKILLHEQDFAIILMDVQMPEMDGFETVELIREIETLKHIPVIFLTASMDNAKHIFKGYQAGAIDYMIKPLIPELLKAKVAVFVDLSAKIDELLVQNEEKEKQAEELRIANKNLLFQIDEKEKREAELVIANKEMFYQNEEKVKRADELILANKALAFQDKEKEERADELTIANKELAFQNEEKGKRADELIIANEELIFQNEEKEKRANELIIANKELIFQDQEKGKRANELIVANKELVFQNEEKEKRAAELIIANKELVFQDQEKGKRANELIIANKELVFQNEEKEKRAAELVIANKELESFNYISSHDLQEPLRKIQIFSTRLIADESQNLSDKGKEYVLRIEDSAKRMRTLIDDLLAYSRTTISERKFETTSLTPIIEAVKNDFKEIITAKQATIESGEMCDAYIIPFQFHQLMHNLIGNALKFSNPDRPPHIIINSRNIKGSEIKDQKLLSEKEYCHITVTDNGIGFAPQYKDHIFEIFKRLHDKEKVSGTGIGLTIAKKIVENHSGMITATGELNKGASFDIYIPST